MAKDNLLHLKDIARSRGRDKIVVEVHPTIAGDVSASECSGGESGSETAGAPPEAGKRWSEDDVKRLLCLFRGDNKMDWEYVGNELGRS